MSGWIIKQTVQVRMNQRFKQKEVREAKLRTEVEGHLDYDKLRSLYEQKEKTYRAKIQRLIEENENSRVRERQLEVENQSLKEELGLVSTQRESNEGVDDRNSDKNTRMSTGVLQRLQSIVENLGGEPDDQTIGVQDLIQWIQNKTKSSPTQQPVIKEDTKLHNTWEAKEKFYLRRIEEQKDESKELLQRLDQKNQQNNIFEGENQNLRSDILKESAFVQQLTQEIKRLQALSQSGSISSSEQLILVTTQLSEERIRCSQLQTSYENSIRDLEESRIRSNLKTDEFELTFREALRWKERYNSLDQQTNRTIESLMDENSKLQLQMLTSEEASPNPNPDHPLFRLL